MTEQESKNLIKETFENDFNRDRFKRFIANLLTDFQETSILYDGQYIKDAYKSYIKSYEVIARFIDSEKRTLDVLITYLKTEATFTARTRQRNFALDYLKSRNRDGILIAYVHKNGKDWRFSFVKLENDIIRGEHGKVKDISSFTAAKRSSFLVGRHENSYTAKKQFLPIIQREDRPKFEDIEEAFSVEAVTDEFFDKYEELFHKVHDALEREIKRKPELKKEFGDKEISTVDFAKKLLGQMVFLYFLQKKGWFGVAPKADWGTGPKNFLRELYKKREKYGHNFFNDVLEPLFYEALAQDRGRDSIYPRLNNCRMPFLNGGLFEPMRGYSWEATDIFLPDELFSNKNKDGEDIGDGILDVFDRYNFTVNESDPLEKEVAVDPEMLGKVFENLLDVKDRKSKGSFYTPREIVHYMCQECLINYLETETKGEIPRRDIESLVLNGETIIQNDFVTLRKQREKEDKGHKYPGTYKLKLPESIQKNARKIDSLLKDIKVCDPAVGSGAFPLGMINEIVGARQVLQVYLRDNLSVYDLKYHAIANSIHGVDIDPGAVDIARLRLWLSLVVEEKEPKLLPNLDYKIMQGNSLVSEYKGIKLFDKSLLSTKEEKFIQLGLSFEINSEIKMKELQDKTRLYIKESQRAEKQELKKEIDDIKWDLIEETLKDYGRQEKIDEVRKLRDKNIKPFFIWELEFLDVFKNKGGFDVVIGNPPYVGEKGHRDIFQQIKKGNLAKFYQGKMDLFYFFFHLALEIGRDRGENAFITTNYYLTAQGAQKLRTDLKKRSIIRNLINFNELKIFKSAKGQHNMITIFSKGVNGSTLAKNCITTRKGYADGRVLNLIVSFKDSETNYYYVKQEDLYDGPQNYIRLEGNRAGNTLIDSILEKIKSQGEMLGNICNVNQGIVTGADRLSSRHLRNYRIQGQEGDGIFVYEKGELNKLNLKADLIKPWYKNSDIKRYYTNPVNKYELALTNFIKTEDEFPDFFTYLNKFKEILINRSQIEHCLDWFDLHQIRMKDKNKTGKIKKMLFDGPKIVAPQRSNENTFGYNESPWYASADVYFITSKGIRNIELKYILALLNSKLYYQWLYHRGKRKGEALELYQVPLSEVPIKVIGKEEQQPFIQLVDRILAITTKTDYDPHNPPQEQKKLEREIDQRVYKLYGLTKEEIELVEKSTNF
ncbi:MAG: Eco57I restriction-modification methylase [bacterium ADurb.Bin363]|nr:MAG: Eco57I restriction-modification methylase [bacterium ADurb.Bin363]